MLKINVKKVLDLAAGRRLPNVLNVIHTDPFYPQEEFVTEGARSFPFTANERRKSIPGFLVPRFVTSFLLQYLDPGSP